MDAVRLGRSFRALRRRLGWRQRDLAARAGVAQQTISDIERGGATRYGVRLIARTAAALDADLDVGLRWRGGALDRLLDERHTALVSTTARRLTAAGWDAWIEVSYSIYGERGSIDVLGWKRDVAMALVIEVKSELTSMETTLRKHDEKARLAPAIIRDRIDRPVRIVARVLVLPDDTTNRRRVRLHGALLGLAYPNRGPFREALIALTLGAAAPTAAVELPGALVFLSPTDGGGGRSVTVGRDRVRQRSGARFDRGLAGDDTPRPRSTG